MFLFFQRPADGRSRRRHGSPSPDLIGANRLMVRVNLELLIRKRTAINAHVHFTLIAAGFTRLDDPADTDPYKTPLRRQAHPTGDPVGHWDHIVFHVRRGHVNRSRHDDLSLPGAGGSRLFGFPGIAVNALLAVAANAAVIGARPPAFADWWFHINRSKRERSCLAFPRAHRLDRSSEHRVLPLSFR